MSQDTRRRILMLSAATFICTLAAMPEIAQAATIVIVAFGDSQTRGLGTTGGGVPVKEAYPAKLERALRAKGWDVVVLNEGVAGRTAAEGVPYVDRLPAANLTIVQLGANDRMQGTPPATIGVNLATIVSKLRARGGSVMLGQNWGPQEESLFAAARQGANVTTSKGLFADLYVSRGVIRPEYNGGDGLHANAAGVDLVVAQMLPTVEQALTQIGFKPGQTPR